MSVVIIPARLGSTRLPGKMLTEIDGVPLVVHVMRRAAQAERITRVIVASSDEEILAVVRDAGGECWKTSGVHPTGTDRVAEVAAGLGADVQCLINVQGDNLDLEPSTLDGVAQMLEESSASVVTPITAFPSDADVNDPSKVKVVLSEDGRALYFSRQPVPTSGPWWLHVGVYGFRRETLLKFGQLGQGMLEKSEGLEQLRLLEHGIAIDTLQVERGARSIDTPRDLAAARSLYSSSQLRH